MMKRNGEFVRAQSNIVGGYAKDAVSKICPDRTINWYPIFSSKAKNQSFLFPWPGLKKIGTIGNGVIRTSYVSLKKNFVVAGQAFYYLDSALVPHALSGNIMGTSSGFVSSASNSNQIAFCDGVGTYYYNGTNVVSMPIPSGVVPSHICAFDNFAIVCDSLTNRFYVNDVDNFSSWNPLRFGVITSVSTTLVASIRLKRRLFIFGYQIGEVWVDAGASSFPFRRDNNLLIEHGIESIASIAQGFELAFYLSRDQDGVGSVMMISGVQPIPISTREIDLAIQSFSVTSDATGSVYKINGHIFYQLNFTSANRTFVFNFNQYKIDPDNAWHELMMLDGSRYSVENHSFYQEKHLMFSYSDNSFYEMNENFFDNDGLPILRQRIYRVASAQNFEQIKIHRYYLDAVQGVGDLSPKINIDGDEIDGNSIDPRIYLSISSDGGLTYKDYGSASIGKIGEYDTRTMWVNIGQRRDAIFSLKTISKRPSYILGASFDYTIEAQ